MDQNIISPNYLIGKAACTFQYWHLILKDYPVELVYISLVNWIIYIVHVLLCIMQTLFLQLLRDLIDTWNWSEKKIWQGQIYLGMEDFRRKKEPLIPSSFCHRLPFFSSCVLSPFFFSHAHGFLSFPSMPSWTYTIYIQSLTASMIDRWDWSIRIPSIL